MPDTPDLPETPALPDSPAPAAPMPTPTSEIAALPADAPTPEGSAEAGAAAAADALAEPAAPLGETLNAPPSTPPSTSRELGPGACADLLKQHFPALFGAAPKPLKLRIQADINQRAPGVFSKAALSAFFRRYTGSTGYLIALGKASNRFDLDGQPAGELSEEHRQLARDELTRRRQLGRERDQQAQAQQRAQAQAQHAQAQAQAHAQQAEQAERQREALRERQARLGLLRDFERTTLTVANFCVLKGLTPDALTPLLAQARQEAAEAPAQRPDDRRGAMGPNRPNGPRPDGRPGDRPNRPQDGRLAGRPDNRPEGRADGRPDGRPDSRPSHHPNTGPGGQPRGDRRGGKPPGPRSGT